MISPFDLVAVGCGFLAVSGADSNSNSGRPALIGKLDRAALAALSDRDLMAEVERANGDAFALLFDRYHRLVLVTALKIVRDAAEAEEVTQSVFLEIYRSARQYDASRGTLKVWLLQFAYHRSINRRNYLALRQFYDQASIDDAAEWELTPQPRSSMLTEEVVQLARESLATLSEAQQRTLRLVFFEGFTLKEVADKTGESFSNVRNHYYRGLDRLRSHLAEQPKVSDSGVIPIREVGRAKA